jgi:glycosyltransferase involved in cell wall biosynthesis
MKPRRVLYVDFYSFVGGGQQNLLSVFAAMDRKRWQPLLVLSKEGAFADAARALKVPVYFVPMGKARWRRPWEAWPAMVGLRRLMREQRVDVVHANCYPANKLAGPAAKPLGIPVLWHKQIAVLQRPGSSTGRLWEFFSRFNARVLAVSKQGFEGLAALGVERGKLRLLYNNADTVGLAKAKPATDAQMKKLGLPLKTPLVLAAGMRRPHKGFDVLLKAWPLVKRKAHLVMMGDSANSEPAHEALLQRLAREAGVTLLPAQRPFAPWLKRAAIFVSSSRWEGSPLVVIEALAAGTPVVATTTGAAEVVDHGRSGYLVPGEDPAALARGLDAVLADPRGAKKRAAMGRQEALKRFSLKSYVKSLADLYDGMLA